MISWVLFSIFATIVYANGVLTIVEESNFNEDGWETTLKALAWPGYLPFVLMNYLIRVVYNLRNK